MPEIFAVIFFSELVHIIPLRSEKFTKSMVASTDDEEVPVYVFSLQNPYSKARRRGESFYQRAYEVIYSWLVFPYFLQNDKGAN